MKRHKARTNGHQDVTPVPFVPLVDVVELVDRLKENAETKSRGQLDTPDPTEIYKQGLVDGAIETCKALLELLGALEPKTGDSGGITEGGDVE